MKINHLILLGIVALFLNLPALHAGGGWPQPLGGGFFKLSEWWIISDQHYTDDGKIDPNVTTGIFNTTLYAEYGFTNRMTGILNFPLFSRTYNNNLVSGTTGEILAPGSALNSIGDADLGLKYGLIVNKPVALSATLYLGLPLGKDNGGSAGTLQTGDGEFNQMLQLDLGASFRLGKLNAYANLYGGINNRSEGFSDELRFGIEGGATFLNNRLTAIGRLFGVKSLKNGKNIAENSTSIFANNSEFLSFSPELAYNFTDRWGVSAGLGMAFSGRIIFANPSYTVGVFLKL